MDILILAAHPDDEVLGMGGTIKKLSKNNRVHLCVVTEGASAQYSDEQMIKKRKEYCLECGKILGISSFDFLNFTDMKLDSVSLVEINKEIEKIIKKYKPKFVYTTPNNDLNRDHQIVFESTLIATRPHSNSVKHVLSYELPSVVRTRFNPTIYENIEKEILTKIRGFRCYRSEIMKFPHPRSIESIKNLAMQRGVESALKHAEAFELIRSIRD